MRSAQPNRAIPRAILVVIAAFAISPLAYADDPARPRPTALAPRGWEAEVAGEIQREAWNYNLSDEDLFGGSAGIWYPVGRNWSIGAKTLVLYVRQEFAASAPLAGLALTTRRTFRQRRWSYFVEGGGGITYAARFVPPRGTRFNYAAEAGAGIIHPTSRYAQLTASFRFLHISNNGLAGRNRNPDIEAFGFKIGMLMPLSP